MRVSRIRAILMPPTDETDRRSQTRKPSGSLPMRPSGPSSRPSPPFAFHS